MRKLAAIIMLLSLTSCVSLVKDVVTAPVKIVSKTADILTTSQSESDEKRGRAIRKKEEELGKLSRKIEKANDKCDDGNDDACEDARTLSEEYERMKDTR
jgi:predicted Holliday junction resolvase-like endonuclease